MVVLSAVIVSMGLGSMADSALLGLGSMSLFSSLAASQQLRRAVPSCDYVYIIVDRTMIIASSFMMVL